MKFFVLRSKQRFLIFLMMMAALLLMAGCDGTSDTEATTADDRLSAVATTGMIADLVRTIGGEHVRVEQLMGPGVDPHLYTATESDVTRLLNADIVFYNGLFLEARMEEVLEGLADQKPSIPVAQSLPQDALLASPTYEGLADPHVWMDVKLWRQVAETIRDELIAFDSENAADYEANAEALLADLDELESYVRTQIDSVPPDQRLLVTAHDAFNYFGKGYAFEVFAPQGISTESEAGVEDIRRTIDVVVENNIPAIFVESSIPPDVVEAIVEGARSRGHEVSIGGELFSDAMGAADTPEGTYIGMIRHNIDTITGALRGSN